jgi:hypothetical protein
MATSGVFFKERLLGWIEEQVVGFRDFEQKWVGFCIYCKVAEHLPVYSCYVSPARSLLLAGSARAREHVFA